jgi:hypothetical protein
MVERNCASDSSTLGAAQGKVETRERPGARGSGPATSRPPIFQGRGLEIPACREPQRPDVGQNATSEAESTVEGILA